MSPLTATVYSEQLIELTDEFDRGQVSAFIQRMAVLELYSGL